MENQIYIYGRDTTTGLIQPLNYTGQGQNVVINTSSSSGSFEIADATDFNDYIETGTVIVNDNSKSLQQGLDEIGTRQGVVLKMSSGSFGSTTPVSINIINCAIEGATSETAGGYLTEVFAPLTLPIASQRVRISGLQMDGGLTVNASGAVIVNHYIHNNIIDGLTLTGSKASGSTAFIRFTDCEINDISIAASWNITTYFIRCSFNGTFTNANTAQGVLIAIDCVGLPDSNGGGTSAVINRNSWAQSSTTQKISAHMGYSGLGTIYSDYTNPAINSVLKWRDEKTALSGGTDKTIALIENLSSVAVSGAYSDLSGKPTLATVATSGAYSDLSGKPTLVDELDELIDVAITPATLSSSSYLGYNTALALWENKTLPTLATVASTGAYSDLSGKPTLATVATSGAYSDLSGKPTLATVATSGSYADLSNKPTIPANLDDLTDVVVSSVSNNQGLIYNSTSLKWENRRPKITDLQEVVFTGLLNNDVLSYNSTLSLWTNKPLTGATPHLLSYVFPASSQNLGVVSTGLKTNNTIDFVETLNDITGWACNTFRITGLTNALYKITAVMGFRRTTTSDLSFWIEMRENSILNPDTGATRRVLASGGCYTANSPATATFCFIADYRDSLPAAVYVTYGNQTTEAAQLVIQSSQLVVERIYNTF
jgi:hypothetical protein